MSSPPNVPLRPLSEHGQSTRGGPLLTISLKPFWLRPASLDLDDNHAFSTMDSFLSKIGLGSPKSQAKLNDLTDEEIYRRVEKDCIANGIHSISKKGYLTDAQSVIKNNFDPAQFEGLTYSHPELLAYISMICTVVKAMAVMFDEQWECSLLEATEKDGDCIIDGSDKAFKSIKYLSAEERKAKLQAAAKKYYADDELMTRFLKYFNSLKLDAEKETQVIRVVSPTEEELEKSDVDIAEQLHEWFFDRNKVKTPLKDKHLKRLAEIDSVDVAAFWARQIKLCAPTPFREKHPDAFYKATAEARVFRYLSLKLLANIVQDVEGLKQKGKLSKATVEGVMRKLPWASFAGVEAWVEENENVKQAERYTQNHEYKWSVSEGKKNKK